MYAEVAFFEEMFVQKTVAVCVHVQYASICNMQLHHIIPNQQSGDGFCSCPQPPLLKVKLPGAVARASTFAKEDQATSRSRVPHRTDVAEVHSGHRADSHDSGATGPIQAFGS